MPSTEFCRLLFPRILWTFDWFLPGFTGFYWVVLGCTELYWVVLGVDKECLLGFTEFRFFLNRFYWVLLGFNVRKWA